MTNAKKFIVISVIVTLFPVSTAYAIPAFPGAEGFGAETTGGRSGTIIEVTNLNDSGTGSLRACVQATGRRICVFRVGGTITLNSTLSITNPNITIAGQTAPGGGIALRHATGQTAISIKTSNVIIRYITARPGPGGQNNALAYEANGRELSNIIVDHSSFSWATDEVYTSWYRVTNMTTQWVIAAEGLDRSTHPKTTSSSTGHSKGMMFGGYSGSENMDSPGSEHITAHHNLIANSSERGPIVLSCGDDQIINNVTYNSRWTFAHYQDNCIIRGTPATINWIGNFHKKGPESTSNTDLKMLPHDDGWFSGGGRFYVQGNIGPSRPNDTLPQANWVDSGSRSKITDTPAPGPTVTTTSASVAYDQVLADAGNNKGLKCDGTWFTRRDAVDRRVLEEVKSGTGKIIDGPSQSKCLGQFCIVYLTAADYTRWGIPASEIANDGWPVIAPGEPCTDTDHDGMPDQWESLNALAIGGNDSALDADNDGYTNIEEYLNGTGNTTAPSPSPSSAPFSGDIDHDGRITIYDYNLLINAFGNPYTIIDYNTLVSNFGR